MHYTKKPTASHVYVGGTAIVIAPYSKGIVLGADKRSNYPNTIFEEQYLDGVTKVKRLNFEGKNFAFAISGCVEVLDDGFVNGESLKHAIEQTSVLFNAHSVAENYFRECGGTLSNDTKETLRKHFEEHVTRNNIDKINDQRLCVVMGEAYPGHIGIAITTLNFTVDKNQDGSTYRCSVEAGDGFYPFTDNNKAILRVIGDDYAEAILKMESDFLNRWTEYQLTELKDVTKEHAFQLVSDALHLINDRIGNYKTPPTVGGGCDIEFIIAAEEASKAADNVSKTEG